MTPADLTTALSQARDLHHLKQLLPERNTHNDNPAGIQAQKGPAPQPTLYSTYAEYGRLHGNRRLDDRSSRQYDAVLDGVQHVGDGGGVASLGGAETGMKKA